MLLLVGLALASSGTKTCRFRGLPATVTWSDSGDVAIRDGADVLVSMNVGSLKGTTSATCLPEGVKFLTDTHERPGDFTLNTVSMKLTQILDTLDPSRFEKPPAKKKLLPKPRRVVVQPLPRAPEPAPKSDAVLQAQSCVRTTVAEGYQTDWGSRSLLADELQPDVRRTLRVTLVENTQYRVDVCGDRTVADIDVWLVDETGLQLTGDRGTGRQGRLEFTPPGTGTYFVVVAVPEREGPVGAAVALSYKSVR